MKWAALVCRYCGHEFSNDVVTSTTDLPGSRMFVGIAAAVAIALGGLIYLVQVQYNERDWAPQVDDGARRSAPSPQVSQEPELETIAVGTTLEWVADEMPSELLRSAGPYRVRITKEVDEDLVAPVVELSSSEQVVRMTGQSVSSGYSHKISVVQLLRGAPPVLMLQSFSGGAHCCNVVQLAGYSNGELKVLDLGTWDGDEIPLPTDISEDGVADFVLHDNSFLYAFASYASSHAPPQILNVKDGKVADVSERAAFRSLYRRTMEEAGRVCRTASSGEVRNGACPAYVAAAARVGKLDEAWRHMVAAYDPNPAWDYPTGCETEDAEVCSQDEVINFKSYPEALLYFLKRQGYVENGWVPPEFFGRVPQAEDDVEPTPLTI